MCSIFVFSFPLLRVICVCVFVRLFGTAWNVILFCCVSKLFLRVVIVSFVWVFLLLVLYAFVLLFNIRRRVLPLAFPCVYFCEFLV